MAITLTFLELFALSIYLASPLLVLFIATIVALGQVVARLEKWPAFDGFYWSFITASTVGYGDIRPTRRPSRLLSILIAVVGLMFLGIITALTIQAASASFERHTGSNVFEGIAGGDAPDG